MRHFAIYKVPSIKYDPAGVNCLGILAIFGWCGCCSLVMFGALRAAGMLRVDAETEASGNDIPKHGESAYPADAWVEMQYKKNVKEARRNSTLPPHMVSLISIICFLDVVQFIRLSASPFDTPSLTGPRQRRFRDAHRTAAEQRGQRGGRCEHAQRRRRSEVEEELRPLPGGRRRHRVTIESKYCKRGWDRHGCQRRAPCCNLSKYSCLTRWYTDILYWNSL